MWHNYSQNFVTEVIELDLGFKISQRVNDCIVETAIPKRYWSDLKRKLTQEAGFG